ncbi:MAG: UDP-3-O-(3-hydroxymyristoyl)glucosamine N-acyltransferase [Bdellovibrionales bacterium]|nr:UDP-3-O-(3-hydroxymyristoyl)glucosamine N-acyltransferase [Bdellovibrionales bacterium]
MDLQLPMTAAALAQRFNGRLVGDGHREVCAVSALEHAGAGDLAFYQQKRFSETVRDLKDAVLLTTEELLVANEALTFVLVSNPQRIFGEVAATFNWYPRGDQRVDPLAKVEASAQVSPDVSVGAFSYVGNGSRIGKGTRILPHCYIGDDVQIGEDCIVFPRVVLNARVSIGNRVHIFSGTVVGSDGFGFLPTEAGLRAVPQIGTVEICDDVRIGANCTIDRATLGATRIGPGTKIDNLVHVGHNCQIGSHCILCAGTGLAGSVILEDEVILGGQVGLGDHVRVGRGAQIGSQGGTTTNLKGNQTYWGTPAVPVKESLSTFRFMKKLPDIWRRLARLESRLGEEPT